VARSPALCYADAVTQPPPLILPFAGIWPRIDPTAFLAPGAVVIGDVEIGPHANLWFNVAVRGDDGPIHIGAGANSTSRPGRRAISRAARN
jgi:hypothetical protein